ncbi:HAD family hydrolase [Thiocystis violacea]|uniref:HAD family hydrolase n=1 Tax=Thiocystis violacea TaxID=13725 RepID=UPI00190700FB|nr:HAD family hydrolase [Thiocystis violacea]MBK1720864.1 hypothetical protein [Thiocystis violacea]
MHESTRPQLIDHIRSMCTPRHPQPARITPRTESLPFIRAVLFDICGTLLVSSQPKDALSLAPQPVDAFASALQAAGWSDVRLPQDFDPAAVFSQQRESALAAKRAEGIDVPEIDFRSLWREVLAHLTNRSPKKLDAAAVERFAIELECRINPPWPMPGLTETLAALRSRGCSLGILANSQFFTPIMFEAVVGRSLAAAGFAPSTCILSHEIAVAKPSPRIFEEAVIALENEFAILSDEVLYVSSTLLQDIKPAAEVGFRTALFAGNASAPELRDLVSDATTEDPPDRILTDLRQLMEVIPPAKRRDKTRHLDLEADLDGDD